MSYYYRCVNFEASGHYMDILGGNECVTLQRCMWLYLEVPTGHVTLWRYRNSISERLCSSCAICALCAVILAHLRGRSRATVFLQHRSLSWS